MTLDRNQRAKLLTCARKRVGTPYDHSHRDTSWRDLSAAPTCFDCSTFVCRVAIDALGYAPDLLAADAEWLLDNLLEVDAPSPGDVVGYGRAANADEYLAGREVVWHVMLYFGAGTVIGACDVAGIVATRDLEYESDPEDPDVPCWSLIESPSYRVLELRPQSRPVAVASIALKKRRA